MAAVRHHHLFLSHLLQILLSLSFFPPSFSQNPTSLALLQFKKSLTQSEDSLTNWKDDGSSPCAPNNVWVGIICSTDTVSSINLAGMGLQGIPNVGALAPLDSLKAVSLENNSLVGPLPAFNLIPSLKAIYASKNQFSGKIPPNYFQALGSLRKLWLSNNKFSGPIPKSIADLSNLKELHLDHNEFSGPIPDFPEIDVLNALDLSNNNLEGPIPEPMNKFDSKVFENNPGLCGPKASKECPTTALPGSESRSSVKWVIMAIVVALLILIILVKSKRKEENVRIIGKAGNIDAAVVTIPTTTKRSSSRKGYNSLNGNSSKSKRKMKIKEMDAATRLVGKGGRLVGDLVMVNEEKGVFGLQDLMKATAEVLGNGELGSAYKATLGNGVSVVVKRVKEMNKSMTKEVFDAEMRKLGRLRHPNILTPLAYHFRKEEKLLVSEYVPKGSLLYVLHGNREICRSELNWGNRLKIIKGVARGMGYLHSEFASYELPHGNLKSCNVLIGKDYEPVLSDYGLHPLMNSTPTAQSMFAYRSPEAMVRQQDVCHKSDVYCLGIIILETVTGKYPCQYAKNQKGGTDVVQWVRSAVDERREAELIDAEVACTNGNGGLKEQIEKLLHIGAACTESEVDARIDMKEAIRRIDEISTV